MSASVQWIDSPSWELDFYGLPHHIPWPADADPTAADAHPLNLEILLEGIDRLGDSAAEPWLGFRAATSLFQDLSESLEEGEVVRSQRLLEEIDRLHPGSPFVQFQLGNLARLEGRDQEALEKLNAALKKAQNVAPIWSSMGNLLAQTGHNAEAAQAFRKALELNGDDQAALEGLVRLRELVRLMRQTEDGKPDAKSVGYVDIDTFRQMISGQIDDLAGEPDQLLALADQLMRDGLLLDVIITALEKAREIRPDHSRTVMLLATAYRAAQRHEDVLKAVLRYTELEPNDASGFMHLAQAYNALGQSENEKVALEEVLKRDPNFHAAIGIYFELTQGEHDPAKEEALSNWAKLDGSWMGHLIASSIARTRGDAAAALRHADHAFELAPEQEEVLLHLSAVLGEARELGRLTTQIRPAIESRKYSVRLDWNFAQTLFQHGFKDEAGGVLRRALALENAPDEFKAMASATLENWAGLLTGCGVALQLRQGSHLTRPILITLPDGDGGIVIGAGRSLPAEGTFPWKVPQDGATQVHLQQGESGGGEAPLALGTFMVGNADTNSPVECHLSITSDGDLQFRAAQNGNRLPVAWRPPQPAESATSLA
jgi:tetratricopeptide (TPR) repeat protein